jgi:hypothetical protein
MTPRKAGTGSAKPGAKAKVGRDDGPGKPSGVPVGRGKAAAKAVAPVRGKSTTTATTGKRASAGMVATPQSRAAVPAKRAAAPDAPPRTPAAARRNPAAASTRPAAAKRTAASSAGFGPAPAPAKRQAASSAQAPASAEVEAWLARLPPPLRQQVDAIRAVFHALSPAVAEEIKWNTPSFRASDDFATLHLRDPAKPMVVFHTGVKGTGAVLRGRPLPVQARARGRSRRLAACPAPLCLGLAGADVGRGVQCVRHRCCRTAWPAAVSTTVRPDALEHAGFNGARRRLPAGNC